MIVVTIREAKTHLSRLLRQVSAGDEIVIARAGRPVGRLLRLAGAEPRRPGLARGRLTEAFFEPLPADELAPGSNEAGLGHELEMGTSALVIDRSRVSGTDDAARHKDRVHRAGGDGLRHGGEPRSSGLCGDRL